MQTDLAAKLGLMISFHRTEKFHLNPPFLQLSKSGIRFVLWQVLEETRSVFSACCFVSRRGAGRGRRRAPAGVLGEAGTCVPAGAPQAPRCGLRRFQLSWKPLQISQNKQTNRQRTPNSIVPIGNLQKRNSVYADICGKAPGRKQRVKLIDRRVGRYLG